VTAGTTRTHRHGTRFSQKQWANVLGHLAPCPDQALSEVLFDSADKLIAQNGNIIAISSDVILWIQGRLDIGHVVTIAISSDRNHSFIIYHPFIWLSELDQSFHMPAVTRQEACATISCLVILVLFLHIHSLM
jgi:hypothetical protein